MCPYCKRMRVLTKKIDDEMRVGRESHSKDRQQLRKDRKTKQKMKRHDANPVVLTRFILLYCIYLFIFFNFQCTADTDVSCLMGCVGSELE